MRYESYESRQERRTRSLRSLFLVLLLALILALLPSCASSPALPNDVAALQARVRRLEELLDACQADAVQALDYLKDCESEKLANP